MTRLYEMDGSISTFLYYRLLMWFIPLSDCSGHQEDKKMLNSVIESFDKKLFQNYLQMIAFFLTAFFITVIFIMITNEFYLKLWKVESGK